MTPDIKAMLVSALLAAAGSFGAVATPVMAQDAPDFQPEDSLWNSSEVLDLVRTGYEARRQLARDGDLETYRGSVEGHVYFFLDPDVGERLLIRIDQVAVQLHWEAPDHVQQHIVGERTEVRLPVRDFSYYADRLTLVQYGFGDEIRVGSGLDVARVPHPLAQAPSAGEPGSPYDFRLAEYVTLSLPGRDAPLRLQDVEVRPRNDAAPGMIGTMTLDTSTGSIVRMAFTFTPASYIDRRTDWIAVEVDYGLWDERFWLPNQQRIEVRREVPEVDLGMGTVIRAVLRAGDYDLNAPLPDGFHSASPVTLAPADVRRGFEFSEGLYEAMERDGLASIRVRVDPAELRSQAIELLDGQSPSGLSPLRIHVPRLSSLIRFNRAEGLTLGAGTTFDPDARWRIRTSLGASPGTRRVQGSTTIVRRVSSRWTLDLRAGLRELRDLGLAPGSDGLLSSLSAAFRGEDYLDPYLASGVGLGLRQTLGGGGQLTLFTGFERVETPALASATAPFSSSRDLRPIRAVSDGDFLVATLGLDGSWEVPAGGRSHGELELLFLAGSPGRGAGIRADLDARWGPASGTREIRTVLRGWFWEGDRLPQGHRLIGGRGTLPGYPFRSFVGSAAIAGSLEAATDLWGPLVRLRGGTHAGWSGREAAGVLDSWGVEPTAGLRTSVSMGLGLGWDVVRVDVARGLNGGEWQVLFSIDPRWWDRL
jgi:hypothetical protein